jgi:Tfp pilus assembly protein PilN
MKAVNLLPPDQRGAAKATAVTAATQSGGNGAYAVLGALAIGVVAVAGYVLTTNTIKERQAKLVGLTARENAATAKVGDLKPYADFAALANTRVATVKDLAGRRFDWENALRDLSRVVPPNVTLSSINGSVSSTSGGTGGSALRGSIDAPAISITGCTDNQRDVATLMARLRTIDGVTRVSLAKSAKNDVAAPTPSTTPGQPSVSASAPGQPGGCKPGSPPSFDMVMFFERDADAATAPTGPGGTTSTPSAATQATAAAATASTTSSTPATAPATATPAAGTQANPVQSGATSTPASTTTSTGATG